MNCLDHPRFFSIAAVFRAASLNSSWSSFRVSFLRAAGWNAGGRRGCVALVLARLDRRLVVVAVIVGGGAAGRRAGHCCPFPLNDCYPSDMGLATHYSKG